LYQIRNKERQLKAFATVICAITTLAATPTFAQGSQEQQGESGGTLDEVNVRTRRDFEERFQSSSTRVTIGRRDIEAMGANTIGDILRQTPGLQVTTTANGGLEIRMRGMGPQNTRIQVDGVAVSPNSRTSQLPLDELPADLIERVEVVRAPTAESQGAAGGTLNIVLRSGSAKRETLVWLSDQYVFGRHAPTLFVSLSGPLGKQVATNSPEAATTSTWNYLLSLNGGTRHWGSNTERERSNTPGATSKTTPSYSSINEDVRLGPQTWVLTPRITGRIGNADRVTIRGIFSTTDTSGRVRGNSAGTIGTQGFTSETLTPWTLERGFHQLGVDWGHSFKNSKLDSTVQVERSKQEYLPYSNSSTTTSTGTTANASTYTDEREDRGLVAKTKWTVAQGEALWSFGGEFEQRDLTLNASAINNTVPSVANSNVGSKRSALWSQYELPIDAIKTSLVFGLRAQDLRLDGQSTLGPVDYQNLFWQPSFNARKALSPTTQARFNVARITRNPRVYELANNSEPNLSSNSPNTPDVQGNPNLRPQITLAMDTGIEQRIAGGGQWGLNLFMRDQKDVIARSLVLQQNGRWADLANNVGDAIVWGIESDIRTPLAVLGPQWNFTANATLQQSKMRNGASQGERIPGQAKYTANISINKPLRVSGGWYGGATASLVGASDYNFGSGSVISTQGHQRAHQQLDFFFGSVLPNLGFWRLNVINATDYSQHRTRVVTNSASGDVYSETLNRRFLPKIFLTIGTRF
jgi:outer membrane receptor for ferrienterochelin and colicins